MHWKSPTKAWKHPPRAGAAAIARPRRSSCIPGRAGGAGRCMQPLLRPAQPRGPAATQQQQEQQEQRWPDHLPQQQRSQQQGAPAVPPPARITQQRARTSHRVQPTAGREAARSWSGARRHLHGQPYACHRNVSRALCRVRRRGRAALRQQQQLPTQQQQQERPPPRRQEGQPRQLQRQGAAAVLQPLVSASGGRAGDSWCAQR